MTERCDNCRFGGTMLVHVLGKGKAIQCRIRAPQTNEGWPLVGLGAWCGEYEPKPEQAA